MESKICNECKNDTSINDYYICKGRKDKRDSVCKFCRQKDRRDLTADKREQKYYADIEKHGYTLKVCKHHGPLKYEDIHLIIKDTFREADRNPKERFKFKYYF